MDWSVSALAILFVAAAYFGAQAGELKYPETARVDVVDDYHGVKVPDPYRWLEADARESAEVRDWIEAQNDLAFNYLRKLPEWENIKQRITRLWNYEKFSIPFRVGDQYCFFKNDGLQNQDVLFIQPSLDAEPKVLMDPNTWSEDGTVALGGLTPSKDGSFLAYGVAEAGSDWRTWRVMDIASQTILPDEIRWLKFGGVSWTPDNKGFFYSQYEPPAEGKEFQSLNFKQRIFYHRLGTPQGQDVLVYQRPDHPEWGYTPDVTEDGRYLVITVWKGTDDKYRILYKDLAEPFGMPIDLIDNFDHEFSFFANDQTKFYFITDADAPMKRIIAIDIRQPEREHWKEIVPESSDALQSANVVNNTLIISYLKDATTQVKLYSLSGEYLRDIELPGIGSAGGFGGKRTDTETFYSFSSIATPPSIYRYDLLSDKTTLLRTSGIEFDPSNYTVEQIFYESGDGTKVPMFIAYKKDLKRDGNNPCLLYGYGGFSISLTPTFRVSRAAWLEMGGIFAMPNLRGGGEYGEAWHRAGTKLNKQNVFDDFIAAAQWLIDNKYTKREKLAIAGGSNGGLLVGAVMTQRPDLFGACLPSVGVMDMLRFHKFTAGRFWVDDYGSSDDPEEFKAIYAYSPYHNIKEGVKYPPTLITTADTDDRVVPGHSFKFAAALQRAQAGDAPVLIRIETRAGHGAGTPTAKQIEELTDEYTFLYEHLGMGKD